MQWGWKLNQAYLGPSSLTLNHHSPMIETIAKDHSEETKGRGNVFYVFSNTKDYLLSGASLFFLTTSLSFRLIFHPSPNVWGYGPRKEHNRKKS